MTFDQLAELGATHFGYQRKQITLQDGNINIIMHVIHTLGHLCLCVVFCILYRDGCELL